MQNNPIFNSFLGIDVSKNKLDIYNSQSQQFVQIDNAKAAIKKFVKTLTVSPDTLVVIDLTGGYERQAVDVFYQAGFAIHRAEGMRVKYFMRGLGQRAKTDKIDAKHLALYGEKFQDKLMLYTPTNEKMMSLYERFEDLKNLLQQEKNRYKAPTTCGIVKEQIATHISLLEAQMTAIETQIESFIMADSQLKQTYDVLISYKGVGKRTAQALVVMLPEIGLLNRRQIAALAGVAPYPHDSGTYSGYRFVKYGRSAIKKALFMIALVGIRYNKRIKDFYEHLINDNHKKKMVALTACMRKIIITLNAKVKECYNF